MKKNENKNIGNIPQLLNFNDDDFEELVKKFAGERNLKLSNEKCVGGRYMSWEHCYCYFKKLHNKRNKSEYREELSDVEKDIASLHLAFYMASWGMYRGSSFLLQYDYKIYDDIVDIIFDQKYKDLWELSDLKNKNIDTLVDVLWELIDEIKGCFEPYRKAYDNRNKNVTDTQITKLLLGTIGCLPAMDRYFVDAIGCNGNALPTKLENDIKINDLSKAKEKKDSQTRKIKNIFLLAQVIQENLYYKLDSVFDKENNQYPIMKMIDMYYFTKGLDKKKNDDKKQEELY